MPYTLQELNRLLGLPLPESHVDCSTEELNNLLRASGSVASLEDAVDLDDLPRLQRDDLIRRLSDRCPNAKDQSSVDYGIFLTMFELLMSYRHAVDAFLASERGRYAEERKHDLKWIERTAKKAQKEVEKMANKSIEADDNALEADNRVLGVTLSWSELKKMKPKKVECTIGGMLPVGGSALLIGKQKESGKTTFLLWLARELAAGGLFLSRKVKQGAVFYLSEMDKGLMRQYGDGIFADSHPVHFRFYEDLFRLSWSEVVSLVGEECASLNCKTLIVDTLARWAKIKDENQANDMAEAMSELDAIPASRIVSVHERKSGGDLIERARGSGVITAIPDQIIGLSAVGGKTQRKLESIGRLGQFEEIIELGEKGYCLLSNQERWGDQMQSVHMILAKRGELNTSEIKEILQNKNKGTSAATVTALLKSGVEKKRWKVRGGARGARLYSVIGSKSGVA
jgi:hypothetical protein